MSWLLALVIFALILAVLAKIGKKFEGWQSNKKESKVILPSEIEINRLLINACNVNNYQEVLRLLYLWLDHYGKASYCGSIREWLVKEDNNYLYESFNKLTQELFSKDSVGDLELYNFIRELEKIIRQEKNRRWWAMPIDLRLN